MRNLNDIEAKAILLLNEIEASVQNGQAVPWQIVNATSTLKQAIANEDSKLGADLTAMAEKWRKSGAV